MDFDEACALALAIAHDTRWQLKVKAVTQLYGDNYSIRFETEHECRVTRGTERCPGHYWIHSEADWQDAQIAMDKQRHEAEESRRAAMHEEFQRLN